MCEWETQVVLSKIMKSELARLSTKATSRKRKRLKELTISTSSRYEMRKEKTSYSFVSIFLFLVYPYFVSNLYTDRSLAMISIVVIFIFIYLVILEKDLVAAVKSIIAAIYALRN